MVVIMKNPSGATLNFCNTTVSRVCNVSYNNRYLGVIILNLFPARATCVNLVVAGVTGTNYIQEWTGMSDSLYGGLYFGLNIVSSIGTIAGRLGMRMYSTSQVSTRGTSHTGQKPYSKIINMREGKITYFDGKGNAYWSRHNRIHGGLVGNPHWHTEIGGHGPEQSYIKMLFRLILKSFWR